MRIWENKCKGYGCIEHFHCSIAKHTLLCSLPHWFICPISPFPRIPLAHTSLASHANTSYDIIGSLVHFPRSSLPHMLIAPYAQLPLSSLSYTLIAGLVLVKDQEKCLVIRVQFRNQAAFMLSNMSFVTRTVYTRFQVAKSRLKTRSNTT